jgi:hypothetical protein
MSLTQKMLTASLVCDSKARPHRRKEIKEKDICTKILSERVRNRQKDRKRGLGGGAGSGRI